MGKPTERSAHERCHLAGAIGIRSLLIALVFVLAACYGPSTRECAVQCGPASDCPSGLVCASSGFCAESEQAGAACLVDDDAPTLDAAAVDSSSPPPDGAADARLVDGGLVTLTVRVQGKGRIEIAALSGSCESTPNQTNECPFMVEDEISVQLVVQTLPGASFAGWTTANCDGSNLVCDVIIAGDTLVGAMFGNQ